MSRFTKELRQEIVKEFAIRHNGYFNPRLFVEEVKSTGEEHPAHGWFQWDRDKAAGEYWLWQAREFASGLKVTFEVQEIGRDKTMSVRTISAPFVLSPVARREAGGGYVVVNPDSPEHLGELCRQAAADLARWLRRYEAALVYAGGSAASIQKQVKLLNAAGPQQKDEAA